MSDVLRYFDPAQAPQRQVGHVGEDWHATPSQIAKARAKLRRRQRDFAWRRLDPGDALTLRLEGLARDWLAAKWETEAAGRHGEVEAALAIAACASKGIVWAKPLPFYGPGAWLVSVEFPDLFAEIGDGSPDESVLILAPARIVMIEDARIAAPDESGRTLPWEVFWKAGFIGLWLEGTSNNVNATTHIMGQTGIFDLSSRTAEEYLRFFCDHLCAEAGAFTLIEWSAEEADAIEAPMEYGVSDFRMTAASADALAAARRELRTDLHARFRAGAVDLGTPLILLTPVGSGPLRLIGTIEYSGQFFRSAFLVTDEGDVIMAADSPIPLVVPRRSGKPWAGPDWLADGRSVAAVRQARTRAGRRREAGDDA